MDIVNRIKTFMGSYNIGSTQFADACGIPRPSLSQILSGRNKKISDEVISKIHAAYPQLSVLWLLFGEGEMLAPAKSRFPEAQTASSIGSEPASAIGFVPSGMSSSAGANEEAEGLFGGDELIFEDSESMREASPSPAGVTGEPPTVQIPADGSKAIVNIMVFYSDNSYQSFVPR